MRKITYAWKENQGEREYREDSISVASRDGRWLFVLADGLGGMGYGAVASGMAVRAAIASFEEHPEGEDVLPLAVQSAQKEVLACQKENPECREMATTIAALLIDGDTARWIHVGDSRIYFFRGGECQFRSKDHSVPQMLASAGMIGEDEIAFHPDRARLLRAVGQDWNGEKAWILSDPLTLSPGDSFLICSDGVWEWVSGGRMAELLREAESAEEWLSRIEAEALRSGQGKGMDNYSEICVFVRD